MPEPLLGRAQGGPDPTRHAQVSSAPLPAPHPWHDRQTTGVGTVAGSGSGTAEPTLPTPGAGQDSILVAIAAVADPQIRRAPSPTASPIEEPIERAGDDVAGIVHTGMHS